MKTEDFEPDSIDAILEGYEIITNQKNKAKKKYQRYHQEWLKYREKYKAILQANIVKPEK